MFGLGAFSLFCNIFRNNTLFKDLSLKTGNSFMYKASYMLVGKRFSEIFYDKYLHLQLHSIQKRNIFMK